MTRFEVEVSHLVKRQAQSLSRGPVHAVEADSGCLGPLVEVHLVVAIRLKVQVLSRIFLRCRWLADEGHENMFQRLMCALLQSVSLVLKQATKHADEVTMVLVSNSVFGCYEVSAVLMNLVSVY